jgi:hypothetical protein
MKRVFQHRESDDKGDPSERDREPIGLELWYEGQNAQVEYVLANFGSVF